MENFSVKSFWKGNKKKSINERFEAKNLYSSFYRLFTNVFKWNGLPPEIDEAMIERYLFEDGLALIWKSPEFGLVVTRASAKAWDINGKPRVFLPRYDFIPPKVKLPTEHEIGKDCVPIYDCGNWHIKRSDVLYKIMDIVDTTETIRQQVFNQKSPLVAISGSTAQREKNRVSIVDIAENQKALLVDSDLTENIKVLDFHAPFNIEGLNAWRNVLINAILEQGGIDSQDAFMKKERKLVDEIEGNDEILNYYLSDCLKTRQKAADMLSDFTGNKVTVEIQKVIRPMMEADGSINGGVDNDNSETE